MKISYNMNAISSWFEPDEAIKFSALVEEAGFDALWLGDNLLPTFHSHGHAPQAWIMLTSMAERTKRIPLGVNATVPMFRYHPIVVAHAFATMASLYPRRILLGFGTGEPLNEGHLLERWPPWNERSEILQEALDLITRFWGSPEYFDFNGKYFTAKGIYCYDKPPEPIPLYISALGPNTAYIAGKKGCHLITAGEMERLRGIIFPAFEGGLKASNKDPREFEKAVCLDIGFGEVEELIARYRMIYAASLTPEGIDEKDPRRLEEIGRNVPEETIKANACLSSSIEEFIELIADIRGIGADHIILNDCSYDPAETIRAFAERVLPYFEEDNKK
ncbi:MAG: LLM class flavin-dependent oxidoreductase [Candidatus Bathyarchaeia archaeon]|nr:LLM class flavin-dependent oxidoreductase [Candidatus Bathyarchaeota archaeon]